LNCSPGWILINLRDWNQRIISPQLEAGKRKGMLAKALKVTLEEVIAMEAE